MRASFIGRVVVEDLGVVLRLAKKERERERERERESKVDVPILRVVNLAILRGSFLYLSVLQDYHRGERKTVEVNESTNALHSKYTSNCVSNVFQRFYVDVNIHNNRPKISIGWFAENTHIKLIVVHTT